MGIKLRSRDRMQLRSHGGPHTRKLGKFMTSPDLHSCKTQLTAWPGALRLVCSVCAALAVMESPLSWHSKVKPWRRGGLDYRRCCPSPDREALPLRAGDRALGDRTRACRQARETLSSWLPCQGWASSELCCYKPVPSTLFWAQLHSGCFLLHQALTGSSWRADLLLSHPAPPAPPFPSHPISQ